MIEYGCLIKGIGSFYEVYFPSGETVTCKARGVFRKNGLTPTVGDKVGIERQQSGYAQMCEILPRRNILIRPAVANIDQLLIVISASHPEPDWMMVDQLIIAAKHLSIEPILVMNKIDCCSSDVIDAFEQEYHAFSRLLVSAISQAGIEELKKALAGKISCFAGQSAVGKSSLLNSLLPDLHLETGELSRKTERGRHTTRHAQLWPYEGGAVLDTPGFSLLETEVLEQDELDDCYPEFQNARPCRFPGCSHITEPDCGVKLLLETGELTEARYRRYIEISKELQIRRKHKYD